MKRLQYSLLAAAGILILAFALNLVGPKRVMAALGYTPIRDVDNPGRQPFADAVNVFANTVEPVPIPAGKRLVITAIGAHTTSSTAKDVLIVPAIGGLPSNFSIPFSIFSGGERFALLSGNAIGVGDSLTYVVEDPGGNFLARVQIRGYLVDVP